LNGKTTMLSCCTAELDPSLCVVTPEVIVEVDTVNLPIIGGGFGTVEVVGTHTERIEPYRAGLPIPPGGIRC
jgi:hypothetical protein